MKLLYSGDEWSYCGFAHGVPLAPSCRMLLKGVRLVVGIKITAVIAKVKAAHKPPTMPNLCQCLVHLPYQEFLKDGGWWCVMTAGDVLWIPPLCLIGEFTVPNPEYNGDDMEVNESLTWVGFSRYHCIPEFCDEVQEGLDFLLHNSCCHQTTKRLEEDVKALGKLGHWLTSL